MHKLITLLALIAITFSWSQKIDNKPVIDEPVKEQVQSRDGLADLMNDLPEAVKAQVKVAIQEQAKMDNMKSKSDEEIEAIKEQKRVQAREQLQDAIKELPADVQKKVEKALEQVQDRIQERKLELKELK